MATETYVNKRFRSDSLVMIQQIDAIMADYERQGYKLTVRQLYYQLVAKDVVPNTTESYNSVKSLVNDARLAGYLDWDIIEDRTREFNQRTRWESGSSILEAVATQFHMDMWEGQPKRVFAVVEKEALAGVLERTTRGYDVPLLAARGYPSVSVLREWVKETIIPAIENDQEVIILHLGDHDPSGIDMTRDLEDRIELLRHGDSNNLTVERIALTMAQIRNQNPPPNPAKVTDARFRSYAARFFPGVPVEDVQSWELDALTPQFLNDLLQRNILAHIDEPDIWQERTDAIKTVQDRLQATANAWRSE